MKTFFTCIAILTLFASACTRYTPSYPSPKSPAPPPPVSPTPPRPAPSPPTSKPSSTPPYRIHVVSKGETLWRISKRYKISIRDIMAVNHIQDPTHLIAGTRLIIPSHASPPVTRIRARHLSPAQKASIHREGFIWPVRGKVVTFFGKTKSKVSKGIEIQAPLGAIIRATQSGRVVYSGRYGPFGNTVILEHPYNFSSVYAHNQKNLVKVGQWVSQGQPIATVGKSGHAVFPNLHFEIRKKSKAVDPLLYLRSP